MNIHEGKGKMGLLCTCDRFQHMRQVPKPCVLAHVKMQVAYTFLKLLTKAGFMSISADSERETPHSSESMDKDNGINLKPLTRVTVRYRSFEICWLSNLHKMPMHKPSNICIFSKVKQYDFI